MSHDFAYPRVRQIAPRAHGVAPAWRTARPTPPTGDPSSSGLPATEISPTRSAAASAPRAGS